MATLYLVRHGEADYHPVRAREWPGSIGDLAPLTARGSEQALAAARQLAPVRASAIVSSPMTRALQTAALAASVLALPVAVDFDLHEWIPDSGFSWRTHAEVRAALDDFERCGGEWPAGEHRAWEPLSSVRAGQIGRRAERRSCAARRVPRDGDQGADG